MFQRIDVDRQRMPWSTFPLTVLNEDSKLSLGRNRHPDILPHLNSQEQHPVEGRRPMLISSFSRQASESFL